jgi:hypothetical protein
MFLVYFGCVCVCVWPHARCERSNQPSKKHEQEARKQASKQASKQAPHRKGGHGRTDEQTERGRTDLELVVLLVEALVEEAMVHQAVRPVEERVVHHQRKGPVRRHGVQGGEGRAHGGHAHVDVGVVDEEEEGDAPHCGAEAYVLQAFLWVVFVCVVVGGWRWWVYVWVCEFSCCMLVVTGD